MKTLVEKLKLSLDSLTELCLLGFGNDGALSIAEGIQSHCSLTDLNLSGKNCISATGVRALILSSAQNISNI